MKVAVIIPCYKVKPFILHVISQIPAICDVIYVVDDKCPDQSGQYVKEHCHDPRVKVIFNEINQGVGGAVIRGYQEALADDVEVCVKIDGDGQMSPLIMGKIIAPIINGDADYTKGNRFHSVYNVRQMPLMRLFGNAILSFLTKMSSGYWSIFDPTNGYTAIHKTVLAQLQTQHISKRYFFESEMLIYLRDIDAVVCDVPMQAVYGEEESGLKIRNIVFEFLFKHIKMFFRRMLYQYFMRDFNLASLHILFFLILTITGGIIGISTWIETLQTNIPTPTGTIMLSVLPLILGFQSSIFAMSIDVLSEPKKPIQRYNGKIN